jgi:hypothetical protein
VDTDSLFRCSIYKAKQILREAEQEIKKRTLSDHERLRVLAYYVEHYFDPEIYEPLILSTEFSTGDPLNLNLLNEAINIL